jgi:hypothetical protein
MGRKTAADKMWEEDRQERRIARLFKSQLGRISTLKEVHALTQESVPDGSPGREYYDRFARFLWQQYEIPEDTPDDEKQLYQGLLERLYANGQLSEEAAERTGVKKPK